MLLDFHIVQERLRSCDQLISDLDITEQLGFQQASQTLLRDFFHCKK